MTPPHVSDVDGVFTPSPPEALLRYEPPVMTSLTIAQSQTTLLLSLQESVPAPPAPAPHATPPVHRGASFESVGMSTCTSEVFGAPGEGEGESMSRIATESTLLTLEDKDHVANLRAASEMVEDRDRDGTFDNCFGEVTTSKASIEPHPPVEAPKRKKRKKSKPKKAKRKRSMQDLEKVFEERELRLQRIRRVEEMEKERVEERRREREKERAMRELRLHTKVPTDSSNVRLLHRTSEYQQSENAYLSDHLKEKREFSNKLSSKNPDWKAELQHHAQRLTKQQQAKKEQHSRDLKELLKGQHQATPTYVYSPTLEQTKRECEERRREEEIKKDAPYVQQLRKQKYGAFVSEMFAPPPSHQPAPPHAPGPHPPQGDSLPPLRVLSHLETAPPQHPRAKARSERNKIGIQNLRSTANRKKHSLSTARPVDQAPVRNDVRARLHGHQYMREASAMCKHVSPEARTPLSATDARMRLNDISKKNIAQKGWQDKALVSLAERGTVAGKTGQALDALHSNSDALLEGIHAKIDILRTIH